MQRKHVTPIGVEVHVDLHLENSGAAPQMKMLVEALKRTGEELKHLDSRMREVITADQKGKAAAKFSVSFHHAMQVKPFQLDEPSAAEKVAKGRAGNLHYQRQSALVELREQEDRAALLMQNLWRKKKAREKMQKKYAAQWEKVWDENESAYYFYNRVTDETRWDKPPLLGSQLGDENEAPPPVSLTLAIGNLF